MPPTREAVATQLEAFIRTQFRVAPTDQQFSRTVPLFEGGYVDSVGVAEVLGFLTTTYGLEIPDEVLTSDAFTTIDGIATAISSLAGTRGPGRPTS